MMLDDRACAAVVEFPGFCSMMHFGLKKSISTATSNVSKLYIYSQYTSVQGFACRRRQISSCILFAFEKFISMAILIIDGIEHI
jgi:hypothetical protein